MKLLFLGLGVPELLILNFVLGFLVIGTICYWRIFVRAGQPGWAALVPIYKTIVILRIIDRPWYWLLLMAIPYLGLIWMIWTINLLVKMFGKNEGFTLGVFLLPIIFLPLLAFGNNTFQGENDSELLDDNL